MTAINKEEMSPIRLYPVRGKRGGQTHFHGQTALGSHIASMEEICFSP
jgi:hypothetical protein